MDTLKEKNIAHRTSKVTPSLTLSIGAVSAEISTIDDGKTLVDLADRQLYEAKRRGRNTAILTRYVGN